MYSKHDRHTNQPQKNGRSESGFQMALTRKKPQPTTPKGLSEPMSSGSGPIAKAAAKRRGLGLGGLLHGIGRLPGPLRKLNSHKQQKLAERRKADEAEASRRRQAVLRNRRPTSVPMLNAAVVSRTADDQNNRAARPASMPSVTILDKPLPKPTARPAAKPVVKPMINPVVKPQVHSNATKATAPPAAPTRPIISDVTPVRPMSRGAIAGHVRRPAQPAVRRVQL